MTIHFLMKKRKIMESLICWALSRIFSKSKRRRKPKSISIHTNSTTLSRETRENNWWNIWAVSHWTHPSSSHRPCMPSWTASGRSTNGSTSWSSSSTLLDLLCSSPILNFWKAQPIRTGSKTSHRWWIRTKCYSSSLSHCSWGWPFIWPTSRLRKWLKLGIRSKS